jgi:hypothetical protein
MLRRSAMVAAVVALSMLVGGVAATAQNPPPRVRGTVASVNGDTVELQTQSGEKVRVRLGDNTLIVGVSNVRLADLKPGRFIGTTAVPQQDGTLRALEIHAYPESMRGTGEGHYPWDLGGETSTMTNGSIGTLTSTDAGGRTMTVTYSGGQQKTVVVPEDTPVEELHPGDRSLIKPGARAYVVGPKGEDGAINAVRVYVGENGVVPTM